MRSLLLAIALLPAHLAFSAAGQDQPRSQRFESRVDVMAIQVFVTDKDGQALGGLTREDFEVLEDGKPRPIVDLQEIDATAPIDDLEQRMELESLAAARRQFLLLFDLSFSNPSDLLRARKAALHFVRNLAPADLAAVATFSVRGGTEMLVGFTSDRGQIAKAVESLGLGTVHRVQDPLELSFWLGETVGAMAPPDPSFSPRRGQNDPGNLDDQLLRESLRNQGRFERGQTAIYALQVEEFLGHLGDLGRALDSLRGRKQILLFSGGFHESLLMTDRIPVNSREEAKKYLGESYLGDSAVLQKMLTALRMVSTSDTLIHTVDVTGLAADEAWQAAGGPVSSGRESLSQLADITGGRFIKDTNDLAGAIGEILNSTQRYYVLAFEPQSFDEPGRSHKIEVRVSPEDAETSHRPEFTEPDPDKEPHPWTRRLRIAEIISKGLTGGPIHMSALAVPYRGADGDVTIHVVLDVDGKTLLDRDSTDELELEVYGYAFNSEGELADVMSLSSTESVEELGSKLRENGMRIQTAFRVPRGRYELRFLVHDVATGRTGAQRIQVTVPDFAPGRMVLYPPLFMDESDEPLTFRLPSRHNPNPEPPFRVAGDVFTPSPRPRLTIGRPARVCVMFSAGRIDYSAGSTVELQARLVTVDGVSVPLDRVRLSRALSVSDGFQRYVLNFTPSGVAPGDHLLRVNVKHPLSGALSTSEQRVTVVLPPANVTSAARRPCGVSSSYLELLTLYTAGRDMPAMEQLARSSRKSVNDVLKEMAQGGCSDEDLQAAALLHTQLASVQGVQGNVDGREFHLEVAGRLARLIEDPDRRESFERRWLLATGYYYQSQLDDERALAKLEEALQHSPDEPEILLAMGTVHEAMNFVGSQQQLPPAVLVAGQSYTATSSYRFMSLREQQQDRSNVLRRLAEAENFYRKCISLRPNHAVAHLRLGRVLQRRGAEEEAHQELEWVLNNSEKRDLLWAANLFMGRIFEGQEQYSRAVDHYRAAVRYEPTWQVAYLALSHALHRSGDAPAAKRVFDEALQRDTGTGVQIGGLWQYYYRLDRFVDLMWQMRAEVLR